MSMTRAVALFLLFFRPASLDFASMGAGINGGILDMLNAQNLPDANFNVPGAGIWADQLLTQSMQNLSTDAARNIGMVDPQLMAAFNAMLGIDASGIGQAGAVAGGQYGGLSNLAGLYSGVLGGQAGQQFAAGQNVYNMGADPQNQLHDFLQQQTVDQARAGDSARGMAMSPYSAGNEATALQNFNMNWQNNQLGRSLAGLQGMNQANMAGGADLSGSMNFAGAQPGYTMASATTPVGALKTQYGMPMDYASMFSQAEGQDVLGQQSDVMSSIYPYLGMAQQGQQAQFNANMGAATAYNTMQQQAQYGLSGGGQSGTPYMQGNQSGAGNPSNWMGMMGGMGGM